MAFYEQISKYYDYIFPVGTEQLEFIKRAVDKAPKRLLDVACGSGGYSAGLSKQGYKVTAIDYDIGMVKLAAQKAAAEGADFEVLHCDMKLLEECVQERFDGIFCIGNSIVHLGSHNEIEIALRQMNNRLTGGGKLILQIINYDRIIKLGINELPPIINHDVGLNFIRKYEYLKNRDVIKFITRLSIDDGNVKEQYDNAIELLPLRSGRMKQLLENAGFKRCKFYGDFNYTGYDENSYMLVVEAEK